MGIESSIPWTDASWNPWQGCHKVSDGCLNCYAERDMKRYGKDHSTVVRSKSVFDAPLQWQSKEKLAPTSRIFVCSWSDFFIEEADAWRTEAWAIMRNTPEYIYIIPTKRPERIPQCLPDDWGDNGWPNVWLGVSTEDQHQLTERWPHLAIIPARVRFLSIEPILDWIQLFGFFDMGITRSLAPDWVIVGDESGAFRRECNYEWIRMIRNDCQALAIPFFLKQLHYNGEKVETPVLDGRKWTETPIVYSIEKQQPMIIRS